MRGRGGLGGLSYEEYSLQNRHVGKHGEDENDRHQDVEEQAYRQEDDPFGSFEKTVPARNGRCFGSRPRIRYDGYSDRREKRCHRRERGGLAQEINRNAEHDHEIGIAIEDRIEKPAKACHPVRVPGNGAVKEIKET